MINEARLVLIITDEFSLVPSDYHALLRFGPCVPSESMPIIVEWRSSLEAGFQRENLADLIRAWEQAPPADLRRRDGEG